MTHVYDELNKSWKSTSRILFGEELGELKEYEEWLTSFFPNVSKKKSHLSGKEITLTMSDYCDSAKFISFEENTNPTVDPLTINEVKDIDSVLEAIKDKWEYAGNNTLGNSMFTNAADLVTDSQYVSNCVNIQNVQNSYSVYEAQMSKYVFGSGQLSEGEFLIGFFSGVNNKRCFNSSDLNNSSDMYLSHNCNGCQNLMFSFHQINKRNCIGNLQLDKDQYQALKQKLIGEIREEIKKTKKFPNLYQIISDQELNKDISVSIPQEEKKGDMKPIEKAFSSTYRIIFQKDPEKIGEYKNWLSKHVVKMLQLKSPFGSVVNLGQYPDFKFLSVTPQKRIISYKEAMEMGGKSIENDKISEIEEIKKWVADTCCFCVEFEVGENTNIMNSAIVMNSANVYESYVSIKSEKIGINSWPLRSKNVFGCNHVVNSQFNINCYNSISLTRCFEVDASNRCTDALFCHNSEGLTDSMFCFNTKGKRYAIGNTQLPPDKYKEIKKSILEQLVDEIEKTKELKLDIYNIGCAKK